MTARSIARIVVAHPLRAVLAKAQRTSQGDYPAIEIVVVEVTTQRRHRRLSARAWRGAARRLMRA